MLFFCCLDLAITRTCQHRYEKDCRMEDQVLLFPQNLQDGYNKLRKEIQPIAWLLRKGLGLQKIKDFPDIKNKSTWEITNKLIPMEGMCVYPVGIKKDIIKDWPEYGYHQEGI